MAILKRLQSLASRPFTSGLQLVAWLPDIVDNAQNSTLKTNRSWIIILETSLMLWYISQSIYLATYLSIYLSIYYPYMCVCIANICNHENNVSFHLSPERLCGNSCAWAQDVHQDHSCKDNKVVIKWWQSQAIVMIIGRGRHIIFIIAWYTHLASVRF